MKYSPIQDSEAYRILDEPYNSPSSVEDCQKFNCEWHATRNALKAICDELGEWDAYEEGDYYLPDVANYSRVIAMMLTSRKMVTARFVDVILGFLRRLDEDYRLDVTILDDYDYLLFLTKEEIVGWCPPVLEKKLDLVRGDIG